MMWSANYRPRLVSRGRGMTARQFCSMSFLPIVERELRVSARRPATHGMRFFSVLAVTVFWLILMFSQRWSVIAQKGHQIFQSLGILALAFSTLAGTFLTADCL